MDRYLITGFAGFVSGHYLKFLEKNQIHAEILGIDLCEPSLAREDYEYVNWESRKIDLLNRDELKKAILGFRPQYIVHLASYSSVAFSWENPVLSFTNNTNIFLNLLEIVRELKIDVRILSIGSSEEYGNVELKDIPLKEDHTLDPVSPYAAARVSQELLSKVYCEGYKMKIVLTRSFNHIGPGQKEIFAVSSFAKQLVDIKLKGLKHGQIETGDIGIVRDFLDVRDVVEAYHILLINGKVGEVYNVCSGKGTTLKEIVNIMEDILQVNVDIHVSNKLIRPNDNKIIIGSNAKMFEEFNWKSKIPIEKGLKHLTSYWENISLKNS